MKYFVKLLLIMLAFSVIATPVRAECATYKLDELGISIDFPRGTFVFTRDISVDQPGLELTNMSAEEYLQSMLDSNTYLEALSENWGVIAVVMTDIGRGNINDLSASDLEKVALGISESSTFDTSCLKHGLYQHKQEKFLKFYWRTIESNRVWDPTYVLQYYTLFSGKAINIYFKFNEGEIDGEKEAFAMSIIDSIVFYDIPDADSLIIESNVRNTSFTIYFFIVGSLIIIICTKRKKRK